MEGEEGKGRGKGREEKTREGRERPYAPPVANSWLRHCLLHGKTDTMSGGHNAQRNGTIYSPVIIVLEKSQETAQMD